MEEQQQADSVFTMTRNSKGKISIDKNFVSVGGPVSLVSLVEGGQMLKELDKIN
jgi:hypothetical protein